MSSPRLSVRSILFGVLLIAVNLAAVRAIVEGASFGLTFGLFSTLPMANLLAMCCYRKFTSETVGPSFASFAVLGILSILGWLNFWLTTDARWWMSSLKRVESQIDVVLPMVTRDPGISIATYSILIVLFHLLAGFLPQLLIALSGGWLARRYAATPRSREYRFTHSSFRRATAADRQGIKGPGQRHIAIRHFTSRRVTP